MMNRMNKIPTLNIDAPVGQICLIKNSGSSYS
jgi:hypothetical protein